VTKPIEEALVDTRKQTQKAYDAFQKKFVRYDEENACSEKCKVKGSKCFPGTEEDEGKFICVSE